MKPGWENLVIYSAIHYFHHCLNGEIAEERALLFPQGRPQLKFEQKRSFIEDEQRGRAKREGNGERI
jgi:hypothetical protein